MSETSFSLLDRLRLEPDDGSWKRLVDLYTPLIQEWLRRQGLQQEDANDLTQEVLTVIVRELPKFRHDERPGSFRAWLRQITVNRLRDFWRAKRYRPMATGDSDFVHRLEQLEDANSALSRLWDQEHDQHVSRKLLESTESEFTATTWRAFRRVVLEGAKAAEVAAELGITANAVWIAKSRVLSRLREELRGLTD